MTKTYTYGQLYKLFGYHKKFDHSDVFGSLIGALVGLNVFYLTKYNGYNEINVQTATETHPELKDVLAKMLNYLCNLQKDSQKVIQIDDTLKSINALKKHRIPMYRYEANYRKYKTLQNICKETVPIQDVFEYLKYLVEVVHKKELCYFYEEFVNYALLLEK